MLEDKSKRKSLGRGLGALLGEDFDLYEENAPVVPEKNVSVEKLSASRYQPRSEFNQEALEALAQSIKEKGVLQPLLVRETANGQYEIIAGERRFRASKMAGLAEVPVVVKNMDDREVLEVALVENLLRENLSAIEEAEGLQRLINEFAHTQDALSQIVGKSRSYIANTLRLLNLPPEVQQMVRDGMLTAGQVRPLVGLENALDLANKILARGLNARQAEALAAKTKQPQAGPMHFKDDDLEEIAGSLQQRLGVKIKIAAGKKGGGKVILQYDNVAGLDKIIDILEQRGKLDQSSKKFTMNIVE